LVLHKNSSVTWGEFLAYNAVLVGSCAVMSTLVAITVTMLTVYKWSKRTSRIKWRFAIRRWTFGSVYVPAVTFMIWPFGPDQSVLHAFFIALNESVPFFIVPSVVWVAIWLSRRPTPPKWASWFSYPIWAAVTWTLHLDEGSLKTIKHSAYDKYCQN